MKKNKKKSYNDTVRTPVVIGVLLLSAALVVGLVIYTQQPTPPIDVGAGENTEREHEPKNTHTNDTIATATVPTLPLGQKHGGKISSGDLDFWKVSLEPERRYQLQMVRSEGGGGGTGDDMKDQIVWGLADSSGVMVVSDKKKNFNYLIPADSDGTYYVRVDTLPPGHPKYKPDAGELGYKFVIKDITDKED
ncbi:hypothetical protein HY409_02115 [Candidatus Gottesmanbacteria bacterium]|nr:hypothetical protein [Candidatus Gottesmanbacteria bacterium]